MTADEYDTGEVVSPNRRARPGAIVGGDTGTGAAQTVASDEGHHAERNRGDQP